MKYIKGECITFNPDASYALKVIDNHCLILEAGSDSPVVVILETDEDRQSLIDVLENPPDFHDEPVAIGPYNGYYLTIDTYRGYLKLLVGDDTSALINDEDIPILVRTLKGAAP